MTPLVPSHSYLALQASEEHSSSALSSHPVEDVKETHPNASHSSSGHATALHSGRAYRKYDHIMQLIALWQEFEEDRQVLVAQGTTAHTITIEEFHRWLGTQLQQNPSLVAMRTGRASSGAAIPIHEHDSTHSGAIPYSAEASSMLVGIAAQAAPTPYGAQLATDTRIGVLIGRMWRFAKFYVKKALDNHAISTLDEFTFLATIHRAGTPTKTEVCVENITEMTTGTEILRRFLKAGLVEEFTDANDRRAKRLKLTPAGERALMNAFVQLRDVSRIVVGTLSPQQKDNLIGMLDHLDAFHTNIYCTQRTHSVEDMVRRNLP